MFDTHKAYMLLGAQINHGFSVSSLRTLPWQYKVKHTINSHIGSLLSPPTFYLIIIIHVKSNREGTNKAREWCCGVEEEQTLKFTVAELATETPNLSRWFSLIVTQLDQRVNAGTGESTQRGSHQIDPYMLVISCCNGWP